MVMAYDQNPEQPTYSTFVMLAHDTSSQITKAVASRSYMQQLVAGGRPAENLQLYRSVEYDLLNGEERCQFFWGLVGILTYLDA